MNDSALNLNPLEAQIVARASNTGATWQRAIFSVAISLFLIGVAFVLFGKNQDPQMMFWFLVSYVALKIIDNLRMFWLIVVYKRVVKKLHDRLSQLEATTA